MPSDIRIDLSFPHHRKRKRLMHFLGPQGVVSLLDLWCKVAEHFPSGHLKDYTEDDIEIDAGWDGDPGRFVEILLNEKIRFLEKKKDGFHLHNWKKRQPWVADSPNRSNISRFNILAKKHQRIHEELRIFGVTSISEEQYRYLSNAKASLKHRLDNFKQCLSDNRKKGSPVPFPLPLPVPLHKITPVSGTFKDENSDVKNPDYSINLSDTFLQINKVCKRISELPKNSNRKKNFNPMEWAQRQINDVKHPGAVLKALDGLNIYWDRSRDPWKYADTILGKVNGTFNENESVRMHEEFKKASGNDQLLSLTSGLLRKMG